MFSIQSFFGITKGSSRANTAVSNRVSNGVSELKDPWLANWVETAVEAEKKSGSDILSALKASKGIFK